MKLKTKKLMFGRGWTLTGKSGAHDELCYAEAECVKNGADNTLLTYQYVRKGEAYQFSYYLGTAKPLDEYMKTPLPKGYFEAMLKSFMRLARVCDELGLSMQRVCFDHEFIFYDPASYSCKFAYDPFRVMEKTIGPLDAIAYIAENATFDNSASRKSAERVLDFIRRCTIFSWVEYEEFLKSIGVLEAKEAVCAAPPDFTDRAAQIDRRDSFGFDFVSQELTGSQPRVAGQPAPRGTADLSQIAQRVGQQNGKMPPVSAVTLAASTGSSWNLQDGTYSLGRGDHCDLKLTGVTGVSRLHAVITVTHGRLYVADNASTNGTVVNGRVLTPNDPVEIRPGSGFQIAGVRFRVNR